MPDGSIDPGSLEGDALTKWYLRSPSEIEQERQAAAARRYQDFFYWPAEADPLGPRSYGSSPSGDPDLIAQYQDAGPSEVSASEPSLTPQPVAQFDGDLRSPPAARFAPAQQPAGGRADRRAPAYGLLARSSATPVRSSATSPGYQPAPASVPRTGQTIAYGALRAPAPSDQELAELRRQQAAFANTTRQIDIHNSWFAVPALAPAVVALGLGAAGEWATGEVAPAAGRAVANFVERDPYLRVGDNWATRAGRRAHAWLEQRAAAKPGWDYEPDVPRPGARPLKPDLGTPPRGPADVAKRYYLELKPNTPTGRAAAARAVKKYLDATQRPVRPIYYDPKDFI